MIRKFLLLLAFVVGCVPDAPKIDNDTITKAIAEGGVVRLPKGRFEMTGPVIVDVYGVTLEGECSASPYPTQAATELIFPADTDGIIIEGRPKGKGERCSVRGLCLTSRGGKRGVGVMVRGARANIVNTSANRFAGHGCAITGSTAAKSNCNLFAISGSTFAGNGGDGLHIQGNNSNVGTVTGCSFEGNEGWGVNEDGTFGSTYISCHTSGNKLGPYLVSSPKACSTFIGCYSEASQPASWVAQRCIVIGGLHGAGFDTAARNGVRAGSYIASDSYGLQLPIVESVQLSGESRPAIAGTPGQFIPIAARGGKTLGWLCVRPGFWYQRVQ